MSEMKVLESQARDSRVRRILLALVILGILGVALGRGLRGGRADVGRLPDVAQPGNPMDRRALRLDLASVDFGEVAIGESRARVVRISNEGSSPVRVLREVTSCGCLRAEMSEALIEPQQTCELNMSFTGVPGPRAYKTNVVLVTDESGPCRYEIEVLARVKLEVAVEPETLQFGLLPKGETKTLSTVIRHIEGRAFEIKEVKTGRPEFSFKWSPLEGKKAYRLEASARGLKTGTVTDRVLVVTEPTFGAPAAFIVSIEGTGDVECTPSLALSKIGRDGRLQPFELILKRRTEGTIEVRSVVEGRGLKLDHASGPQEGLQRNLSIRLLGDIPPGSPVGEFLIHTTADADPIPVPYRIEVPAPTGDAKQP